MFSGRVFPTHVGMNRLSTTYSVEQGCIPHARGDEPIFYGGRGGGKSYSPRTWG